MFNLFTLLESELIKKLKRLYPKVYEIFEQVSFIIEIQKASNRMVHKQYKDD